ncbi:hypothetical protein D3C87_1914190 [compost metagenome]
MLNFPRRAINLAVVHVGIEHVGRNIAFHVRDLRFHLVAQAPLLKLRLGDLVIELRQVVRM